VAKFKLVRKIVKVGKIVEIPDNARDIKRYDELLDSPFNYPKVFGAKIYYLEPVKEKKRLKNR